MFADNVLIRHNVLAARIVGRVGRSPQRLDSRIGSRKGRQRSSPGMILSHSTDGTRSCAPTALLCADGRAGGKPRPRPPSQTPHALLLSVGCGPKLHLSRLQDSALYSLLAVRCCAVPCFAVLHRASPCFTVLYCAVPCFTVLHCASCFTVLYYIHCALLCCTVLHCASLCFTVLHCASLCFVLYRDLLCSPRLPRLPCRARRAHRARHARHAYQYT